MFDLYCALQLALRVSVDIPEILDFSLLSGIAKTDLDNHMSNYKP